MPIYRIAERLVLFVHIPKCGGSSAERWLHGVSCGEAFVDKAFSRRSGRRNWSRTSPQHADADTLERLFPAGFFDYAFAITRHPEDRLVSEYRYRRGAGRFHGRLRFSDWLEVAAGAARTDPCVFDGHLRPQSAFLPAGCRTFRLEDGLDAAISAVAADLNLEICSGPGAAPRANLSSGGNVTPTRQDRTLINALYAEDFERLGYAPRDPDAAAPDGRTLLRRRLLRSAGAAAARVLSF